MVLRWLLVGLGSLTVWAHPGLAADKAAVFPFELEQQASEDDFFIGAQGPNPDEVGRLSRITSEFMSLLAATGKYDLVDMAPLAAEISDKAPLFKCNGCDVDLAKKAGAGTAITGLMEKASSTTLRMVVSLRDAESGKVTGSHSVVVQGNTDDAWMHAIRYIVKRKMHPEDGK